MKNGLFVFAERRMHEDRIGLYIVAHKADSGNRAEAINVTMRDIEPNTNLGEPALKLTPEEATALADELWLAGIRPRAAGENAGALAATERHLKDMQRLVFRGKENE